MDEKRREAVRSRQQTGNGAGAILKNSPRLGVAQKATQGAGSPRLLTAFDAIDGRLIDRFIELRVFVY